MTKPKANDGRELFPYVVIFGPEDIFFDIEESSLSNAQYEAARRFRAKHRNTIDLECPLAVIATLALARKVEPDRSSFTSEMLLSQIHRAAAGQRVARAVHARAMLEREAVT